MHTKSNTHNQSQMRLYGRQYKRLYINASERWRFAKTSDTQDPHIRALCLTLLYTGCRLSEALELSHYSLQGDEGVVSIRSLKKRNQHHVREIPIPQELLDTLTTLEAQASPQNNRLLWHRDGKPIDRITAYRWVKAVMAEAGITGPQACPKGLRHGFGIHAVASGVQLNMLQKWMGHASIKTTAIYANAVGREEREIARKMW